MLFAASKVILADLTDVLANTCLHVLHSLLVPLCFQSQHDIEARIDEILSKIAILQSAQQTANQITPAAKSAEANAARYQKKLDELEAQLSALTRDRLEYLEKLHQQQLDVQVLVFVIAF